MFSMSDTAHVQYSFSRMQYIHICTCTYFCMFCSPAQCTTNLSGYNCEAESYFPPLDDDLTQSVGLGVAPLALFPALPLPLLALPAISRVKSCIIADGERGREGGRAGGREEEREGGKKREGRGERREREEKV